MRMFFKFSFLLAVAIVSSVSFALQEEYNCRDCTNPESVVLIEPSAKIHQLTVKREWNAARYRYVYEDWDKERKYPIPVLVQDACWADGGSDELEVTSQKGACWLAIELQRGKDFVLTIADTNACNVSVIRETAVGRESFSFRELKWNGKIYRYIKTSDWRSLDPASVRYLVNVGGWGKVGTVFSMSFQEISIDEVVTDRPGTLVCPIPVDVSDDGSTDIAKPVEQALGVSLTTAYVAPLTKGKTYVFRGISPSADYGVQLRPYNLDDIPDVPVYKDEDDHSEMMITASADYNLLFLAMPDDLHWTENVGGGVLEWTIGLPKPPEPIGLAVYSGTLSDVDFSSVNATFDAAATIYDDGSSAFVITAHVNGVVCELRDNGNGEVTGEMQLGGRRFTACFLTAVTEDGKANLDGSLFVDNDGIREYWFSGDLEAGQEKSDDFSTYNPDCDSASAMGLTNVAFSGLSAGTARLKDLWRWGNANGVKISQANVIRFLPNGDPDGLFSEAYLLNCSVDAESVAQALSAFRIVSFAPAYRVKGVVVFGGAHDGEAYGNGVVEVRTSPTAGGCYDKPETTDAKDGPFYRAALVCGPDVGRNQEH